MKRTTHKAPTLPGWVLIVRESPTAIERSRMKRLRTSRDAFELLKERLATQETEIFVVVSLDAKGRAIAMTEVSRGGLHGCAVGPRDIFRVAVAYNANAVIVAHNHPSGDPTPSPEDIATTKIVVAAGTVLGIAVLDHIVVGDDSYVSFEERDLL